MSLSQNYFLALSTIAIVLLWGVSLGNGTVREMFRAVHHGLLGDETPLKTNYTDFYVIDYPLSLLVSFFFRGTSGAESGYQLFLIDAYATLQPAFVWLYVESNRPGVKPFAVANPILWASLWQAFGAAIALPLYYYHHLAWVAKSASRPLGQVPSTAAYAIPFSFGIGAVLPAVIGMLPMWVERSTIAHQNILAVWQLDPLWVSIIQSTLMSVLSKAFGSGRRNPAASYHWIRASYLAAAMFSAVGHIYALAFATLSSDPGLSVAGMYVPFVRTAFAGEEDQLLNGPWLFLQFDLIIIAIASLSWVYLLLADLMNIQRITRGMLMLAFSICSVVVGAGATVSMALFWREGLLEQLRKQTEVNGGENQKDREA
ncbi:MAG: hypothetical protein LQ346_002261 [Caloplaca aetnensis]|nr:MAG: hypothetical protein LQ346_002261 [Caloplaca aetnensis]